MVFLTKFVPGRSNRDTFSNEMFATSFNYLIVQIAFYPPKSWVEFKDSQWRITRQIEILDTILIALIHFVEYLSQERLYICFF